MTEKIVKTINNIEAPISQCRKFEAGYYLIGNPEIKDSGDCYYVNDAFYREETGRIVFDLRKNRYVMKNELIVTGIVGFNNAEYTLGQFSLEGNELIAHTTSGNSYYVIDASLLEDNPFYKERLSNGEFYAISELPAREFNKIVQPRREYKESLPYDSKEVIDDYKGAYEALNIPIHKSVEAYSKTLKGLSFGLEFETSKGLIPDRVLNKLGLIPLRDGSIPGIEYVTVPMEGAKGVQNILNICDELNKRTEYDESCSFHLHLGGVPRTKEFILAFFKLTLAYQEQFFQMFPLFKQYNFGVKRKNYTKPYDEYRFLSQLDTVIDSKNIDRNFNVLFEYLAEDRGFDYYGNDLANVEVHPLNPGGNQKWNIHNRYHFINFIQLLFGNKQTIEFRIHTPTHNANKIMSFMMMNACLINFTIANVRGILEDPKFFLRMNNLESIINAYFVNQCNFEGRSRMLDSLKSYIRNRTQCTFQQSSEGNIRGNELDVHIGNIIDWTKFKPKSFLDAHDLHNEYYHQLNLMIPEQHFDRNGILTPLGITVKARLSEKFEYYTNQLNAGAIIKQFLWE